MNTTPTDSAAEAATPALKPTSFFSRRNVPLWMGLLAAALFAAMIAWPR